MSKVRDYNKKAADPTQAERLATRAGIIEEIARRRMVNGERLVRALDQAASDFGRQALRAALGDSATDVFKLARRARKDIEALAPDELAALPDVPADE